MLKLPLSLLAVVFACFCLGVALEHYKQHHDQLVSTAILFTPAVVLIAAKAAADQRKRWWPRLERGLTAHTAQIDAIPARHLWLWIALAAGLGLYAELAIIRFHGSCFQLFAFFKNLSLLSCFLGLGIGYATGSSRLLLTPLAAPLLAFQVIALHALRFTGVGELLHNPISEHLALGLDQAQDWAHAVGVYGFLALIFGYNALCFIPFGQLASRLMSRSQPLPAYGANLGGSLAGILVFYGLSFLWAPPAVWVALLVAATLLYVRDNPWATAVAGIAMVAILAASPRVDQYDLYSPYQILSVKVGHRAHPEVKVNHVYFQNIWDLHDPAIIQSQGPDATLAARYYGLPYVFKAKPDDVLVVGSGTGNDVASAVRHGAGHVDAVEIDPAILRLGKLVHPERPYEAPNVTAVLNDARAHLRTTDRKYDLIVYGLLDSHTLLSNLSGVRLDSYIYTVEGFRDARARLKPGGVICLSFAIIRGELGRKLYLMLSEAFDGRPPIAFKTSYDGGVAFVIGEGVSAAAGAAAGMEEITSVVAGDDFTADKSTDDWPFFYMPVRRYPVSYAVMVATLLAVAWVFIARLARSDSQAGMAAGFSLPCFLLGAGFMLLETKAITELALFYGSTWIVVGVVIAAILALAFLANLLLMRLKRVNLTIAYALLLLSVALSLWAAVARSHPGGGFGRGATTLVLTFPLFFAGLVFSSELERARSIGAALSSNLLGAMLGGFLEYNSMYFGYRSLYVLALLIYGAAFFTSFRSLVSSRLRASQLAPGEA